MTTLTPTEINEVCNNVLLSVYNYETNLYGMFYTMFNLGCRETETVQLNRWTNTGFEIFELQTMKRGGIRVIPYNELVSPFISGVLNPPNRGFLYSSRNLRDVFNKFSAYKYIYCKNKEIN